MPTLTSKDLAGLTEQEAAARLAQFGYNELPSARPRSLLQIALGVLREPMLLLLAACVAAYFALGDLKDAAVLAVFVFVVIGITLVQERKTERALAALRDLSSPRALVIRGGRQQRIAGREVVPGDLLILSEGDRVPADGVLLLATSLSADESLLTGESVPVRKAASDVPPEQRRPGGDDLPFVYSGTLIVRGNGVARAGATGLETELGKIGKTLQSLQPEPSFLQKETARMVRALAFVAATVCGLLMLLYGLTRHDWWQGFLSALTLAMALLPEELPVILIVFLALGAWRISRVNVLTRRMPAIERLGAATVLCVDKTGTLTANRMTVRKLLVNGQAREVSSASPLPEEFHELAEFAVLASRIDAFDPMDIGIRRFGETALASTEHLHNDWSLVREYPLAPDLLAISEVWTSPGGGQFVIAAKGAPEAIADLCHLSPEEIQRVSGQVAALAGEGLRVLGVARADFGQSQLPEKQHDFGFHFAGLVGLEDPLRPGVPAAVGECREAGIRVTMITGDYLGTAESIARQAGLGDGAHAITGPELAAMPEDTLRERARGIGIFARAVPEQKLRLVNALKAAGDIVAMTGDGVNDAPALKAAHIGVAMGERGTDVARETADLVLLDDDFSSIVKAVRMGRRIFDNLKKAVVYTSAIHVPIAALSVVPILLRWPVILKPVHIAFLELIIDPACSIVFEAEPEEPGIMRRPPRPIGERLFQPGIFALGVLQGAGAAALLLVVFAVALSRGENEAAARAVAFTALVLINLGMIQTNRSRSRNVIALLRSPGQAFGWITLGAAVFLAGALYLPFLRGLFDFAPLRPDDLGLCAAAAGAAVLWFEALKIIVRQRRAKCTTSP